ncbi:hypothetical protein ABBQ32_007685 [Trebouxia sp. C0010 RCD-2024]
MQDQPAKLAWSLLDWRGQVPQWLADSSSLSQLYAGMTATQLPASSAAGMEPGLCQATYLIGLAKANALQEKSVAPKTLKTNPMLSNQLRRMTKGYKAEASQQGYHIAQF